MLGTATAPARVFPLPHIVPEPGRGNVVPSPRLLGSDEHPPEAATPKADHWTLPNGRRVARAARGVRWAPALAGDSFILYFVDSAGDTRGSWRMIPANASAETFDEAEREMQALLDAVDPPPRPRLCD